MDLKEKLRTAYAARAFYQKLRTARDTREAVRRTRDKQIRFEDRRGNQEKLVMIIAGYKEFLWPTVFARFRRFIPADCDVCIASSGKHVPALSKLAKEAGWSYLATSRNNVALLQNIVITHFPAAQFIFKVDEDIFATEGLFSSLLATYHEAEQEKKYNVGFVAPLIPLNGYGHVRVLEKLGLADYYAQHFEEVKYAAGRDRAVEDDPQVAEFFWGAGGFVPPIDELARRFKDEPRAYRACPIRFSIGCILFTRSFWESMGMFAVAKSGPGMGADESQICAFCIEESKAMIIDENALAGHLSFGKQNAPMKDYYLQHADSKYFTNG